MVDIEVLSIMQSAVVVGIKVSAPILVLSMLVGLLISIFQAATQINEQTMTFVPKLLLIALIVMFAGSWMLEVLVDYTKDVFLLMLK